jgi:hypothetical protein
MKKTLARPPTPVAPVKAPAASPLRRWKKIVPGQLDLALLYVLELQASAHVKDDPDVHRGVRVLLSLSNTQPPSSSAFEYAPSKRGRSYNSAWCRFVVPKKPSKFWHSRKRCTNRHKLSWLRLKSGWRGAGQRQAVFTASLTTKLPSPSSTTFATVHPSLVPPKHTMSSPSCTMQDKGRKLRRG